MKPSKLTAPLLLATASVLSACGGGGDDQAGSPTAFSTVPSTTTFTAPVGTTAGVCVGGGTSQIFVYGGAAPYRIDNTVPAYVNVDKTQVSDRGGSFTVTALGPCVASGQIVIVDKLNNTITLSVTNSPVGSGT